MQLPLCLDPGGDRSLQCQLFDQIRDLICDGRLKPGLRLPASRVMAADLGVSRNTVIQAYERLEAEGYLDMRPPRGTFVSACPACSTRDAHAAAPAAADATLDAAPTPEPRLRYRGQRHIVISPYPEPARFDFWVGRPDARLFPILDWARNMKRRLRYLQDGSSGYGDPAGLWDLRVAIADYVGAARGVRAHADQVLIVNGIQEGLSLMARLFIHPGTEVVVESPGYMGAANVFTSYGARLLPVPVDGQGMCVDALPRQAVLAHLTPSHQYPTGSTLSPERRGYLLKWAQACGAYLLEDDYDSDFYYDQTPLPALKSQDDGGRVIYMGTFSKSLGAGLRVGYLILPQALVEPAVTAKCLLNNCTVWLIQALLADFLMSGAYRQHLHRIRRIYAGRRDALVRALQQQFGAGVITGDQCGMHLVWHLPQDRPEALEVERRAREVGVGVYSFQTGNVRQFHPACSPGSAPHARALMLGYAALREAEITEGISRLARLLA